MMGQNNTGKSGLGFFSSSETPRMGIENFFPFTFSIHPMTFENQKRRFSAERLLQSKK